MSSGQITTRDRLQELLEIDEGLTQWEVDFIENLSNWASDFTPKQIAMIDKIYERRL